MSTKVGLIMSFTEEESDLFGEMHRVNETALGAAIDRTIEDLSAIQRGAWPMRIMLGVDAPVAKIEWKDPALLNQASLAAYQRHLDSWTRQLAGFTKTPYDSTHHQEATMTIDKKDYVTAAARTPAGSLAQRHIGSLVTITLPSGAEITDVLTGVAAGYPAEHRREPAPQGHVVVFLANVNVGYDAVQMTDRAGDHVLGPKSVVLVRRPKPVTAAKKKAARR